MRNFKQIVVFLPVEEVRGILTSVCNTKNRAMATVILMKCGNAFEAEVVKGRLESEGIPSILQGENSSFLRMGMGYQSGFEVNVLVAERDYEKAVEIVNDTVE